MPRAPSSPTAGVARKGPVKRPTPPPGPPPEVEQLAVRKLEQNPDLSEVEAVAVAGEQLDAAREATARNMAILGRMGINLTEDQAEAVVGGMAHEMKEPTPPEQGQPLDQSALLTAILNRYGLASVADLTALLELAKDRPVRLDEGDQPVILSPAEEAERARIVAARARTAMAMPSYKAAPIVALLQVPKSEWVRIYVTEQIRMWRNGVLMQVGKGWRLVPPYVAQCYQEYLDKTKEEHSRIAFEQSKADLTEQVLADARRQRATLGATEEYGDFSWRL